VGLGRPRTSYLFYWFEVLLKTYLVTGGAGFIGSHIVEALVARGEQVRVLDNLCTGHRHNLEAVESKVEFIEGDINDADLLQGVMRGVDCVFHQAALASVPLSVEQPLDVNHACVTGTLNVLNQARLAKVRRVVYAASSSCYGNQPNAAKREGDRMMPLSPYAAAKLGGELYCQAFYHTYGLETVGLRYFNVFGPRQDPDSPYSAVIPLFITRMLAGKPPVLYGDGMQSRDFTFIGNVVDGNLLASEKPGVGGKIYNLANGRSTDLLTLISTLNQFLKINVNAINQPARVGDVRDSMADITMAMQELGYVPRVDFVEGVKRSIDYYRSIVTV
jgi:UDP-glucose 4-epimerase